VIEIEVQNETHQTQERIRFAAVPRIGEGLRLREPDGMWASYDVLDVWYQKAEYGDIWMPYLHVCMTPEDTGTPEIPTAPDVAAGPIPVGVPVGAPVGAPVGVPVGVSAIADQAVPGAGFDNGSDNGLDMGAPIHHEDEAHDLTSQDAFASLAREPEPFKI